MKRLTIAVRWLVCAIRRPTAVAVGQDTTLVAAGSVVYEYDWAVDSNDPSRTLAVYVGGRPATKASRCRTC